MYKYKYESIPLDKLLLDPQNARHGLLIGQAEIMEWMASEIKDKEYNLAKHMTEHGPNPSVRVIVYPSEEDDGYYIVAEGNRRVTVMKWLNNAESCPDESLKGKIKNLMVNPRYPIPSSVDSVIMESWEAAQPWVRLNHAGEHEGAGVVPWGAEERERFNKRIGHDGPDALAVKTLDWAKEEGLITDDQVRSFPVTNLTRILSNTEFRKVDRTPSTGEKSATN